DAADVLVDRHPVARALVDHALVLPRAAEAVEVPGRIDEGVHGVGLALRRVAALRAVDDRYRAAPVALARDAPVAQAPLNLFFPQPFFPEIGRDCIDGLL